MRLVAVCGAMLVILLGPVVAQPDYDVKIEQAAKDVIARKIGDLRTGSDTAQALATIAPVTDANSSSYAPKKAHNRQEQRKTSKPGKMWRGLLPTDVESRTVGSVQTFGDANPAEPPAPL